MSYQIKNCPTCSKPIHIHNRKQRKFVKNACEHVPYGFVTKTQLSQIFKEEEVHEQEP